jgi:hypothetical protein
MVLFLGPPWWYYGSVHNHMTLHQLLKLQRLKDASLYCSLHCHMTLYQLQKLHRLNEAWLYNPLHCHMTFYQSLKLIHRLRSGWFILTLLNDVISTAETLASSEVRWPWVIHGKDLEESYRGLFENITTLYYVIKRRRLGCRGGIASRWRWVIDDKDLEVYCRGLLKDTETEFVLT